MNANGALASSLQHSSALWKSTSLSAVGAPNTARSKQVSSTRTFPYTIDGRGFALLLRMRDTHTAHTNYTSSIIDTCIDQDTLYIT